MIDTKAIEQQLRRLANDPACEHRHRRTSSEALRILNLMNEDLIKYKEIEELFEQNERLQRILAEELEKQNV